MSGALFCDVVATVPTLLSAENPAVYGLKCFRVIHFMRLTIPVEILLSYLLQSLSKKRQGDLISFTCLIVNVCYLSHVMACIWLGLGRQHACGNKPNCIKSWVYDDTISGNTLFVDAPYSSQYIFAFYWIFEVITTVGYGDYSGATSDEYIFSVLVEFIGLTFFSFFMGNITELFSNSDNFEDIIEKKLDNLDLWIKKIEKSNKPYYI